MLGYTLHKPQKVLLSAKAHKMRKAVIGIYVPCNVFFSDSLLSRKVLIKTITLRFCASLAGSLSLITAASSLVEPLGSLSRDPLTQRNTLQSNMEVIAGTKINLTYLVLRI